MPQDVVRRPCDVVQQVTAIERFHQKRDRAISQRLLANVIVIMGRDEDDRQLMPPVECAVAVPFRQCRGDARLR